MSPEAAGSWFAAIQPSWLNKKDVWEFLNSSFFQTVLGTALGAYGGAVMAGRIAKREAREAKLIGDVRAINTAIGVVHMIFSNLCALKRQHVRELVTTYNEQCARRDQFEQDLRAGRIPRHSEFVASFDFKRLAPLDMNVETLRELLVGKVPIAGRPLALVFKLPEVLAAIDDLLRQRNSLVEDIVAGRLPPGFRDVHIYFAIPFKEGGSVISTYQDLVRGIGEYVDDAIFFSQLLVADLHQRGSEIAKEYNKAFDGDLQLSSMDFEEETKLGLIPDAGPYHQWLNNFVPIAKPPRTRWGDRLKF